ncbi:Leucine-rich repeat-containing N-terminal, plant-type [Dillenia turbinata]|uniref:Leucine-rich repeat-containing N-terminal, plant-type n=1 Tax=Dillenia turbinata TaxID=194707 RepID=A0AAN8UMA2_9MAGN
MGMRRSVVGKLNSVIYLWASIGLILISTVQISHGLTNPDDVTAINSLYKALGSPVLPGWAGSGGDPCGEAWQGVQCNNTDISSIILNGANLGGELGDNLGSFSSIRAIELSNNHIGGSIPSNLPLTMQNFFLSANQFTGSIPSALGSLTKLTAMSLNYNLLSGEIPDSFQSLMGLINLDLSNNNLSGELPSSLQSLSSLTTLHLQNNQLSGTLDILQDLPLKDLNVENNQFNGPIPEKLYSIPNFKKDGNPFNSTVSPVPSPASPSTPLSPLAPPGPNASPSPSRQTPARHANEPSASDESNSGEGKKFWTSKKVVWISIAVVLSCIMLVLGFLLCLPRCCREREEATMLPKRHSISAYNGSGAYPEDTGSQVQSITQLEKEAALRPKDEHQSDFRTVGALPKSNGEELDSQRVSSISKRESHEIDMTLLPPPPPPPPPPLPPPPPPAPFAEKIIVRPISPPKEKTMKPSSKTYPPTSARSFTIASLQQYTNSFSQDNLLGGGMLGSVYRARLPDGKLLAVKKLDKRVSCQQKIEDFFDLVNDIDKIRHENVVEFIGFCAEHGQQLLVHEYCGNGTLQDALHSDDEFKKILSWNARIRVALGAARALEYLHEICQPPIMHRNFKSANVFLDDELAARVSDCGLASLISTGSVSQYRTRIRGEQFLVRWAIPQLHDIDALSRMVDPTLNGEYPAKSLSQFADIISRCLQTEPEFRPLMSEVVQDLIRMIQREHPNMRSDGD